MRLLCLDYGERYVGVAITDEDGLLSVRHGVIDQKINDVLKEVKHMVEELEIQTVLVGVPLSLSGDETTQTHVSLEFMEKLRLALDKTVEVIGVDETLTSVEADHRIKSEGVDPNESHAEAARIMLDDYLRGMGENNN